MYHFIKFFAGTNKYLASIRIDGNINIYSVLSFTPITIVFNSDNALPFLIKYPI